MGEFFAMDFGVVGCSGCEVDVCIAMFMALDCLDSGDIPAAAPGGFG